MALDINQLIEQAEAPAVTTAPKPDKSKAKSVTAANKKVVSLEGDLSRFEKVAKNLASSIKIRQSRGLKFDDLFIELTQAVNNYNKVEQELVVAKAQTITSVPGAGRGTAPTAKPVPVAAPALATVPTGPTAPAVPVAGAPVATTPTPAPTVPVKPAAPAKAKSPETTAEIRQAAIAGIGINATVVQYMKENYPEDWKKIEDLLRNTTNGYREALTASEIARISTAFKQTEYYKKAAVEKNRTTIGAYFIQNGLDTLANKSLIDKLTKDVYVSNISTPEQAFASIRQTAAQELGLLDPTADENKKRIASAMIDGGQTFMSAAGAFTQFYKNTLNLADTEFDPFESKSFIDAFKSSTSFDDFTRKVKSDPLYINSVTGRQEIDSTKNKLNSLYRNLGLGFSAQKLEETAIGVISGKQTFEQLEYGLRNIAAEALPAFRDRILAGESVASISQPYVYSMSRILELPDSSIDITDPTSPIRKALIGDGKSAKPLWQFEQDLFKDSRWQYTSNARDTFDKITTDVLSRFGVMG
jgi:hypothetical protein